MAPKAGTMGHYRLQAPFIGTGIHKSFSPLFNKAISEEVKNYAYDLLTKRLALDWAKPYFRFTVWMNAASPIEAPTSRFHQGQRQCHTYGCNLNLQAIMKRALGKPGASMYGCMAAIFNPSQNHRLKAWQKWASIPYKIRDRLGNVLDKNLCVQQKVYHYFSYILNF